MHQSVAEQQQRFFGEYSRTSNDPKYRKIWAVLQQQPVGRILDVGCTNGALLEPMLSMGWDCSGMELCEEPAQAAAAKGIKVTVGDASGGLPFQDGTFDVVVAGEIVEHMTDDVSFLRDLRRVTKPSGLVIITTPNLVSLGNRLLMMCGAMPRFAYAEYHYRIYNRSVLLDRLRRAELTPLHVWGSYVGISRTFNDFVGRFGESLGYALPALGEHFVVVTKT